MELIQGYESDSNNENEISFINSSTTQENIQTEIENEHNIQQNPIEVLKPRQIRSIYLITYSQADKNKFPDRTSFAQAVVKCFETGKLKVMNWACCLEKHSTSGEHYHMAIKLTKNKRWLPIKNKMQNDYSIVVHFSAVHENYFSAWRYITKSDKLYIESENHPDLTNATSPQTSKASRKRRGSIKQNKTNVATKSKKMKLTNAAVSEIIKQKNINNRIELNALAYCQKEEGKTDLFNFIINRNSKKINELITQTWEIETAQADLKRLRSTRIELIHEALNSVCATNCNREWFNSAIETIERNQYTVEEFSRSVRTLLTNGRGKFRNIIITGPANCGKTFLLKPITLIFKTFVNPATSTFAWVGAEDAEVIFLNDFRWNSQIIQWHDLLLLLEGESVHLPAPKSHYAKDILLNNDTPIFCTSSSKLTYIKNGVLNDRETEMMDVRWKMFNFNYRITESEQKSISPCARCFAELVFM